jgi:transposase-like protein
MEWLQPIIGGAIAGLVIGGVAAITYRLVVGRPKCPDCGEPPPAIRTPANRRQFWWGGWTCPKCGCEVNSRGREVQA